MKSPGRAAAESPATADRWQDTRIRALVFTGGAGLMALQIAGSRVLAPHFGSSLFIWAGLIGVFLAALSIGYFAGGRIGDEFPHIFTLNVAVGGAGLMFLFIPQISIQVCSAADSWGPRFGPLAAAAILFTLPSVFLGTVSPIALRLHAKQVATSGSSAGSLYAISTIGSLVGTFATTFVLVPAMGTPLLIMTLGALLAAAPLFAMPLRPVLAFYAVPGTALALAFFTAPLPDVPLSPSGDRLYGGVIHETETPYHRIFVVEGKEDGKQVRYLQFDHYLESGITVEPPYESVTRYTDMFHLGALFAPQPRSALFIGGGGMVGPRIFEKVYPSLESIEVVEIDPEVVRIAKEYFKFEPGPKVKVTVGDGRMFLMGKGGSFDMIVLDAYSGGGRVPFHLLTREFFEAVKARLTPDGVVLLNLIGAMAGPKSKVLRAAFKTMQTVFTQAWAFPRVRYGEQTIEESRKFADAVAEHAAGGSDALETARKDDVERVRNVFLAATASKTEYSRAEFERIAAGLVSRGAVPRAYDIEGHAASAVRKVKVNDLPLLTDDFAPVEQWKTW